MIFPSTNLITFEQNRIFSFSFFEYIDQSISENVICQFEDASEFKAIWKSSQDFECNLTMNTHQNLTFWFKNSQEKKSRISLNSLDLYHFRNGSISYANESKQFGNTEITYTAMVKIDLANIPSKFYDGLSCEIEGSEVKAIPSGVNKFNCSISSTFGGFKNLNLKYKLRNAFKIPNIHNTFLYRLDLTYGTNVIQGNYLKVNLNTLSLIENGKLKADCSDLIVTFKGKEISGQINGCNTSITQLKFQVQETKASPITEYSLFYGNLLCTRFSFSNPSSSYSTFPTIVETNDISYKLNSNEFLFGFLKPFSILNIDPVAALVNNSAVNISTNYEFIDYLGKIKFELNDGSSTFKTQFDSLTFNAILSSNNKKRVNLTINAIYLPNGEIIQGSLNFIEFVFIGIH
jgi:hypothetical protein